MFTFLVIVTALAFIALLLFSGAQPRHTSFSMAELQRRAKHSVTSKNELARENALPSIEAMIRIKSAVLLVLTVLLLVTTFGWVIGIILAIIVAIFYLPLARSKKISQLSNALYLKLEPQYLKFVHKFQNVFTFFSDNTPADKRRVDSKEEFQELIERSGGALTEIERKVIAHALDFNDKEVASIMTRRSEIATVDKDEFLGPLVLDEIHSLGHSRLPVIDGDLDHIVGILHLRDMLSLDVKRSSTAEKAMDPKVHYIRKDDSLERALAVLLKVRHHILIVTDDQSNTVGLVTLEDIIESLLGRRIVDES